MRFYFLYVFAILASNRYVKHFQIWEILFLVLHDTINIPFLDSDFNDYDENAKNSDFTDNSCAKCEEKFDDLVDLAVHFNKKHERVSKRLKCPVCPKMLYSIGHLKDHVNVTHLKRYLGQKKRPTKTIGTVICKINHQIRLLALKIGFKMISRLQYQILVAKQLLEISKKLFILIIIVLSPLPRMVRISGLKFQLLKLPYLG